MKLTKKLLFRLAFITIACFGIQASTVDNYKDAFNDIKTIEKATVEAAADYKHIAIFSLKSNSVSKTQLANRLTSVDKNVELLAKTCAQLAKRKLSKSAAAKRALFIKKESAQKASHRKFREGIKAGLGGTSISTQAIALRNGMKDLKVLAQDIRAEVQTQKNDD